MAVTALLGYLDLSYKQKIKREWFNALSHLLLIVARSLSHPALIRAPWSVLIISGCGPTRSFYKCNYTYSLLTTSNSFAASNYAPLRKVLIWKINTLVWFPCKKKTTRYSINQKRHIPLVFAIVA